MHELVSKLCGTVDIWDEDPRTGVNVRSPHELQVAEGTCVCATEDMTTYVAGAVYLGTQGPADWPAHVWRVGEHWTRLLGPKDEDPMRAVESLGPIGPVHMAEVIRLYEHEPFVPARTPPPGRPPKRAWSAIDPPPTITVRDAVAVPVPPPVVKLIVQALSAGFEVRAGHALADIRAQRTGEYRPSETWSVQGRGPGLFTAIYERDPTGRRDVGQLIACDHQRIRKAGKLVPCAGCAVERGGWSWDRITVSLDDRTFPYAGRTDLDAWLAAGGRPGELWRRAILKRERDKAEKTKATPSARKRTEDGG